MKKLWILLLIIICLGSCNKKKRSDTVDFVTLTLANDDSVLHKDEQLIIKRSQLKKLDKQWESGMIPLIIDDGDTISSQVDDVDGDGKWDEVALVFDVDAKSKEKLILRPVTKSNIPSFLKKAHAFLGKSAERNGRFINVKEEILPKDHQPQAQPPLYQMEGPVWENDKGAFRLYFDVRNGKDIFGKTVSEIMMDSVGLPGGNYHEQQDWGMDVLKVGESLGAGALAFSMNEEGKQKIYRLGPQVNEMKYESISDGPVRAVIQLTYTGVHAGDRIFDVQEKLTIWAGSPGYSSKVSISNTSEPMQLVTGIVNLHATSQPFKKTNNSYALLGTHDKQSENDDFLGMAVLVPKENFVRFDITPNMNTEITHTHIVVLEISPQKPATYEFLTAWEGRDESIVNPSIFWSQVQTYAQQKFHPVHITVE